MLSMETLSDRELHDLLVVPSSSRTTNSDQPKWSGVDQWQMGTMTVRADHLLIHTGLHPYAFLYLSLSLFMMATGG